MTLDVVPDSEATIPLSSFDSLTPGIPKETASYFLTLKRPFVTVRLCGETGLSIGVTAGG